jgi:uncharacterized protein (TIGR01777 family)
VPGVKVAVTGSSGLIGSSLVPGLEAAGHDVVRLVRREPAAGGEVGWDPEGGTVDLGGLAGVDAIVHLAGETIGKRWTEERKRTVLESRTTGTRVIAEAAAALDPRPSVLLCASAVGVYGDRGDELLTETSARGEGFLADVVTAWEAAADPARAAGIRVVHLRQGLVLSRRDGALARLLLPFRLGLGGPIGSGEQWWSWVVLEDVVGAYLHALERPLAGPVNVVAPEPVRNRELARALGRALHRPAALPFPPFAVRLLLAEMGEELLLASQRALPSVLAADGYAFRCRTIAEGLARALAA